MQNKGLLFIPDISGFTKFVSETEIDHSRQIIQELLEVLINSNEMGLEISEIEGDAILFYKFGEPPPIDHVYKQVEKMFRAFHKSLIAYDNNKYCQCKACLSAIELTLKVITHYGEFTGYNVKQFSKLIGKDIIVAHQLLKNDIAEHEYWLVTKNLQQNPPPDFAQWMRWNSSSKQTDTGTLPFHYTHLTRLKDEVELEPPPSLEIPNKVKMVSLSRTYDTDIITLFHAVGEFGYRNQWLEGAKMEGLDHHLPRVGMHCRSIVENGETILYASSYSYDDTHIEFSETDHSKTKATYFRLIKKGERRTTLTLEYYIGKNFLKELRFRLFEKAKMQSRLERSMEKLATVADGIVLPS